MQGKGRVLIVDDDQSFGELTRRRLAHLGFTVDFHCGGFGVTQKLSAVPYDLLLIDFNMPGLSGDSLVKVLRSRGQPLPLMVFFSSAREEDLAAAVERAEMSGFVSKSATIEELGRRIDTLIQARAEAAARK